MRMLASVVLIVCASYGTAHATISVNSLVDSVVAGDASCTLREAITNANLPAGGDTTGGDCAAGAAGHDLITLPTGSITITLSIAGANEDANAAGDLDITDIVTIRGSGRQLTKIDQTATDRVLHVVGSIDGKVRLEELQLRGGERSGNNSRGGGLLAHGGPATRVDLEDVRVTGNSDNLGGGIAIRNGTIVTLTNRSEVTQNTATSITGAGDNGGGIHVDASTLNTDRAVIAGNVAQSAIDSSQGGGIYAIGSTVSLTNTEVGPNEAEVGGGLYAISSDLTITGGEIIDNEAELGAGAFIASSTTVINGTEFSGNLASLSGGAISKGSGTLEISNASIFQNIAFGNCTFDGQGGGLQLSGTTTLDNVTIRNNSAGRGGGVFTNGTTTILNSTIEDNDAECALGGSTDDGGGILNSGGTLVVERSLIASNTSDHFGGGLACFGLGTCNLINTTLSGNHAAAYGGGIFNNSVTKLDFCTIVNNTTLGIGGGLGAQSTLGTYELANTILAGNVGNGPSTNQCGLEFSTMISHDYNMVPDTFCNLTEAHDVITDPLVEPLADHGGPWTHLIRYPSLAGDSADPLCTTIDGTPVGTDQRGFVRPRDFNGDGAARCDRGAYEAPDAMPIIPPPVPNGAFGVAMSAAVGTIAGTVDVNWDISLCPGQESHLIFGDLAAVGPPIATGASCDLGLGGAASGIAIPDDSWFLILTEGENFSEGSWGEATAGPRSGATNSGQCGLLVRDNTGSCP